jgi:hypothetical protein
MGVVVADPITPRPSRDAQDVPPGIPGRPRASQALAPAAIRHAAPDIRADIHGAKRNTHFVLQQVHHLNALPLNTLQT